jgi:Ca2+-binding EF-hand superfamily protein
MKSPPSESTKQSIGMKSSKTKDLSKLSTEFPLFTFSEISSLYHLFELLDEDKQSKIHQNDIHSIATKAGISSQLISMKMTQLKLETFVTFNDFLRVCYLLFRLLH